LLAWGLGSVAGAEDPYGVRIQIEKPVAGSVVRGRTDVAPLAGVASADGARPSHFDVMLVVDVSGSTKYPSGVDVDGDGEIGETRTALMAMLPDVANTDPEDSVLAAEAQASNALIDGLAPQRVRIGVVSFSGEVDPATGRRKSPDQQDAFLEQPLTNDFTAVRRALEAVVLRGASGGTNMQAGLTLATRELAGLQGAQSEPKIIINSYGLGPVAIDYPIAATEMARVTGGVYTPVRRPGDIVSLLSGVTFANVEDVVAVNLTIGEMAGPDDVLLLPDGSFSGFVPVSPGMNRIRVSALASDGSRGSWSSSSSTRI
jgi:hypothetical protein